MTSRIASTPNFRPRFALACCAIAFAITAPIAHAAQRPNIVWFVIDDMSANFSCYGEQTIETPHVDRLAKEGLRFTRAYATAPICSAFRSALITGMYQTSIGAHHHRSGRGEHRITLPRGARPVPALFQDAGYYTCIGSGLPGVDSSGNPTKRDSLGKTDYNFDWENEIYDSHDWAGRAGGQPFFMQVQLHGGKIREKPTAGTPSCTGAGQAKENDVYGADEGLAQASSLRIIRDRNTVCMSPSVNRSSQIV